MNSIAVYILYWNLIEFTVTVLKLLTVTTELYHDVHIFRGPFKYVAFDGKIIFQSGKSNKVCLK